MKNQYRKLVALVLTVLMLTAVAGCGAAPASSTTAPATDASQSGAPDAKPVTLTFMANISTTSNDTIKPVVEAYKAEGVTIEYQSVPGSTSDYQQKLTTLFAANTYPDVLYIPAIWSKMHGSLGIAQKLDGQIPADVLADFNAGPLETCKYEGELIGLPINSDCITVFYNKAQLEKAGVTVPASYDKAWTWEEFEQAATKVKTANDTMYGVVFGNDFSVELPFFWQSGATVLNPELNAVTVNQQGTVETLNWFRKLVDTGLCTSNILLGVDDADAMFANQRSPFLIGNSGGTTNMLNTVAGSFEVGVTYLPRGKENANKIGGWNIEVLNKTENLPQALEFLQYMASPESMNTFCVSTGTMPTRKAAASTIAFGVLDPYAPLFIDQIANIPAFAINDSVNSYYATYKGIMSQEFQNFIATPSITAEDTAKTMEEAIKQAIKF